MATRRSPSHAANIARAALRRAENGWEDVVEKVNLSPRRTSVRPRKKNTRGRQAQNLRREDISTQFQDQLTPSVEVETVRNREGESSLTPHPQQHNIHQHPPPMLNAAVLNLLPVFEGKFEENAQYFIEHFKSVANMANLKSSEMAVILKSKLKSDAQKWLHSNPRLQREQNFEVIAKELLEYFDMKKSVTQQQADFNKIVQKPGMKVLQLRHILENAMHKYLELSDIKSEEALKVANKVLMGKFIQALRGDIRLEVRKADPKNFMQAFEIAQRVESALDDNNENEVNNIQTNEQSIDDVTQELQIEMLRAEINNLKMSSNICRKCSGRGHFEENCTKIQAPARAPPETHLCIGCGSSKHYLLQCVGVKKLTEQLAECAKNNKSNVSNEGFQRNEANQEFGRRGNYRGNYRGNNRPYRGNARGFSGYNGRPYSSQDARQNLNGQGDSVEGTGARMARDQ